jgi:TRAP-type C4-dicarboxylate transport system substrate-binding protein
MSTEIDVLDMPLVFRDHDHATKVLDGEIGKDLMETVFIGSNGRIKGLAFTYSGGFRNFYSTQNISSLKDFAGMPMRNLGGRMSRDFVHHFDPDFVYSPAGTPEWIEDIKSGKVQIDESEVIRLAQYQRQFPEIFGEIKTVFETNHNLYLTLLAVNAKVFGALTPEQQAIVQEEANTLAEQERLLSIQQEQDGKAEFQKLGIKFITPSEEDKAMMQEAANIVHNKYRMTKGRWLRRIEDVK